MTFRLLSQDDYRQIAVNGRKIFCGKLFAKWIPSPDGVCRFCFVAKRKNGCAVFRNRCRRILRPYFFNASAQFAQPMWCMVFVGEYEDSFDRQRLHTDAQKMAERLGQIIPNPPVPPTEEPAP